jgi:anthranilate phosphoribosyltransferase
MKQILTNMFDYHSLSRTEAAEVLTRIAAGEYNNEQMASFVTVYLMRPITLDELMGFREALLNLAIKVDLSAYEAIDIVGTGGDGKNSFNISTLSCFVVAGAGFKVAKHGNYGATSVSGASNVLEYFGARFTSEAAVLQAAIERCGFAFLHAPLFNPAMKNIAPVRKALGVRTFFNVLGPLINPAQPQYQLLGVYSLTMLRLYKYINERIGTQYTLVHSLDGYDELSLTAEAKIINNTQEYLLSPEHFVTAPVSQAELSGGNSVGEAALLFERVLENRASPAQTSVVVMNAALAIQTLKPGLSLETCRSMAEESLFSGRAKKAFKSFLEIYS